MGTYIRKRWSKRERQMFKTLFNRLFHKWLTEWLKINNPKSTLKIKSFIHNTKSILKLLPAGHRFRGDVEVL